MKKTKLSLIAAIAEDRGLGKDGKLLFHIPRDLKRFKKITLGHPIIMGRKTFESIGRVLPGRTNIIITRNKDYKVKDGFVFNSLKKAVKFAKRKDKKEVFVIGGGQIYKQAINSADKLYLTLVKEKKLADTFFPEYEDKFKKIVLRKKGKGNYIFLELEK
jgi:dihydrofolate reductase